MNVLRSPPCNPVVSSLCVAGCLGSIACGADSAIEAFVVTDSAGVEIVTNRGAIWSEGGEWRVSPEPVLSIGTFEGDAHYELHQVSGAIRLVDSTIVVLNGEQMSYGFMMVKGCICVRLAEPVKGRASSETQQQCSGWTAIASRFGILG